MRNIAQAKCCCFVPGRPGVIAVGLDSGHIKIVNISALMKPNVYYTKSNSLNA